VKTGLNSLSSGLKSLSSEFAARGGIDLDQLEILVIPEGYQSRIFVFASERQAAPMGRGSEIRQAALAAHLASSGMEVVSESPVNWGRPWVEVVVGVGLPNIFNARAEVRVTDQWAVGIGGGVGLLPAAGELTARYTPGWACWNCQGRAQASLSFGPDVVVMPDQGRVAVILAGAIEAEALVWLTEGLGLTIGTRWGLGVTRDFGPDSYSMRVEPALTVGLLQVGAVFGARR
jgi:hypothetical protein